MSGAIRVGVASPPFFTPFASCYAALLLEAIALSEGYECVTDWGHIDFAATFIRSDKNRRLYKRLTHEENVASTCPLSWLKNFDATSHEADVVELGHRLGLPADTRDRVSQEIMVSIDRSVNELRQCHVVGITATRYQLLPDSPAGASISDQLMT